MNWQQTILQPVEGRARQRSSAMQDLRGPDWWGIRPIEARRKRIMLEPGETHTMMHVSGPGLISRIWMTAMPVLPLSTTRDLVLRFHWDNESQPSVECSFADFFGSPFGRARSYVSAPLSYTSGGFNSLFPMPFSDGARLEITNEGPRVVDPMLYAITYYDLDQPPETSLRFHAQWRRANQTPAGQPHTILEATGSGHFVGCRLDMQNRHRWLGRHPIKAIFPLGLGFGMLEGQEHIFIDDDLNADDHADDEADDRIDATEADAHSRPSIIGTGTEDYFNAGWYFAPGRFDAPTHGCTMRNWFTGRVSAYRFDVTAPIPFQERIRVEIDRGIENTVEADYSSVAYWYQTEPHDPFPALPPPEGRRLSSTVSNLAQSTALAAPVAALAVGAARRRMHRVGRTDRA